MRKTEVYSWRVAFDLKRAVSDRFAQRSKSDVQEEEIQRQLHQSAAQPFSAIRSGDPNRSQEVSQRMKSKVREHSAN